MFFQRLSNLWGVSTVCLALLAGSTLLSFLMGDPTISYLRGFVWVAVFLLYFWAFISRFAPLVLPLEGNAAEIEGESMLSHYFNKGADGSYKVQAEELPYSFRTLGIGIVPSHLAVITAKDQRFHRAVGPGYVRLESGKESIASVFDLRLQRKVQTHRGSSSGESPDIIRLDNSRLGLELLTRDQVALKVAISVMFRVSPPKNGVEPDLPYPYADQALFALTYADSVNLNAAATIIPWQERIAPHVMSRLAAEINQHTLDEIFDKESSGSLSRLRHKVEENFKETYQEVLNYEAVEDSPIGDLSLRFLQFTPPTEVTEQRLRDWEVGWQQRLYDRYKTELIDLELDTEEAKPYREKLLVWLKERISTLRGHSGNTGFQLPADLQYQLADTIDTLISMGVEEPKTLKALEQITRWIQREGGQQVLLPPPARQEGEG